MSSIKDQIITLVKQRHHSHKVALEQEKDPRSKHAVDLIARIREDSQLIKLIDSLPEDASCIYDTNELTPTPSVNIEDVARVQFASHAHVFDRKRKAVFDWEQFKEVAGIFYGFGKRDSLPEEKPLGDLEGKQMIKELKERIVGLDNNGNPIAAAPPDIPMIVEKVNEIIRCLNATQRE